MKTLLLCLGLGAGTALSAVTAFAQDIPSPEQIIADNDKNGDKAIDRAEWAASPAPVPFPEEFDVNHDGKIDLAELQAMFASFQGGGAPPVPAPQAPQAPQNTPGTPQ
jgi:hypothetical protein